MRALPSGRRARLTLAVAGAAAVIGAPLALAPAASAAPAVPAPAALSDNVTFIGDSITAGFGYCGTAENAPGVSCTVNQPTANSWFYTDPTLRDCAPPDPPAALTDACSNNNDDGQPWLAPPWHGGPDVAYPFQIAGSQSATGAAAVRDWAVSGSTPASWDPDTGGVYGPQLRELKNQYVVMTLGGNPLLGYFTNINFRVYWTIGKCVKDTGYHGTFSGTRAYPIARAAACLDDNWAALSQARHLEDVYEALLAQGDKVLVMGYYRDCPWSFGFWQYASLSGGPAAGESCTSQSAEIDGGTGRLSQWQQAVAIGDDLNTLVHQAVTGAQDWAKQAYPHTTTDQNLAWTAPTLTTWAEHQGWSATPWVVLNDTWIHPNQAGAQQLAGTVTAAMCKSFGRWCGSPPVWG